LGAAAEFIPDRALTKHLAAHSQVLVRRATEGDLEFLAELRLALWPGEPLAVRRSEAEANLAHGDRMATLVALDGDRHVGFAEVSLRQDYVNGCVTSPVAFLEGIYVRPEHRGRGVGRALVIAAEQWARVQNCLELGSDALLDNQLSHRFHRCAGFEETERVIYFRKRL
jgi:aminoglycoside 6'-N-acetyltransferase I